MEIKRHGWISHFLTLNGRRSVGELIDALRVVKPSGGSVAYEERWAVAGTCARSQWRSRQGATPHSFQAFRNPRRQKAQTKEEETAWKELRNPRWVDTDDRTHYYRDIILSDKSHRYVVKLFCETLSSVGFRNEPNLGKLVVFQCTAVNVRYLLTICTGLFEMIVGVLTTCHIQYIWDGSIHIFNFLAVQVIFICVYINNYLHFITMCLSF